MPNYANLDSINKYYESLAEPINANIKQAENDYNTNAQILKNRYDTSLNTSKTNRQAELDAMRQNKENSDAQAYRSLQRQLYTVPDAMSAAGAQGGMVDSGIAYIKNRYLQGRNDRDTQLAANNADIGRRYDQADADLLLGYNTDNAQLERDYQNALEGYRGQLAQYEQQAAADRAEWEYQQALAAAAAGGGGGGGGGSTKKKYYGGGSSGGSGGREAPDSIDVGYTYEPKKSAFEKAREEYNSKPAGTTTNASGYSGKSGSFGNASTDVTPTTQKKKSGLANLNTYLS